MPQTKVIQRKQGLVDINGNVAIQFDPPPMGYTLTGTVTIIDAPLGSVWSVFNTNDPIDVIVGANSAANLQCDTNEYIKVTSTLLAPGIIINAIYYAVQNIDAQTELIIPSHDTAIPPVSHFITKQTFTTAVSNNFTIPLNPNDRRLEITFNGPMAAGNVAVIVTGQQSGIQWTAFVPNNTLLSTSFGEKLTVPVSGFVDHNVTVAVQATTMGASLTMTIVGFSTDYAPADEQNPILVGDPFGAFTGANAVGSPSATIIGAPPTGFNYEVCSIEMHSSAVTAALGTARVAGLSSAVMLAAVTQPTGVVVNLSITGRWVVGEGLAVNAGVVGVAVTANIWYRQIPATGL